MFVRLNLFYFQKTIISRGRRPLRPRLILGRINYFVYEHVQLNLCIMYMYNGPLPN